MNLSNTVIVGQPQKVSLWWIKLANIHGWQLTWVLSFLVYLRLRNGSGNEFKLKGPGYPGWQGSLVTAFPKLMPQRKLKWSLGASFPVHHGEPFCFPPELHRLLPPRAFLPLPRRKTPTPAVSPLFTSWKSARFSPPSAPTFLYSTFRPRSWRSPWYERCWIPSPIRGSMALFTGGTDPCSALEINLGRTRIELESK